MTAPLRRYGFEDAERCVQCALCLTHCPTYRLTHDESESPRGRLAMLAAWDRDEAPLDPSMRRALDHCLGCLACEAVCPAEVPYGKLIDRYHEVTASPTRAPSVRLLVWLTHQHGKAAWLHRLLAGLERMRMLPLLKRLAPGRLRTAVRLLPDPYPRAVVPHGRLVPKGAAGDGAQRVSLLAGCVSSLWMADTYVAARELLLVLGFTVDLPDHALCCGALARHAGDSRTAQALRAELLRRLPVSQPILVLDSGCLAETRAACGADGSGGTPVYTLTTFLEAHWPPAFEPALRQPERIALHVPCTQRPEIHDAQAVGRLLGRIQNLTLQPIPIGHGCCGAAGSYFLREPTMSDAFGSALIASLGASLPERIVTTNIGCRLQWQSELRRSRLGIPVEHPVETLLRACPRAGPREGTGS
ncbi:protein of unknown function cysteine-rich region domain protein [mine drainage metagenome]|uniref:4Fe-4S ferredoxin-type domain-containing protein n=1 Tax=mine drainage metagenome TaxID=410659 RepID=T1BC20_9ZZZZ